MHYEIELFAVAFIRVITIVSKLLILWLHCNWFFPLFEIIGHYLRLWVFKFVKVIVRVFLWEKHIGEHWLYGRRRILCRYLYDFFLLFLILNDIKLWLAFLGGISTVPVLLFRWELKLASRWYLHGDVRIRSVEPACCLLPLLSQLHLLEHLWFLVKWWALNFR